jgi:glycine dehydrogenase
MKLNAASEMLPLSTAQWNNIHPFAPLDQAQGTEMLTKLEQQPNIITVLELL